MGDTVAAFMVYVPIQKALNSALKSSRKLAYIGGGCILIALLITWIFLEKGVVAPIRWLNQRTNEISLGKNLDHDVEIPSRDEIGRLAESIERLRMSITIAMQRIKK
jgi:HAMP domain-containing protein